MTVDIASNAVQSRGSYRTFLSNKTVKLVEVNGCGGYSVTGRCVKPTVVLAHSVLVEISKSCITRDLPSSCKYVNSSEVYDNWKYDDSNIVGIRSVNKENKINVKTTFVNKQDNNNTVDVRNVSKVNK